MIRISQTLPNHSYPLFMTVEIILKGSLAQKNSVDMGLRINVRGDFSGPYALLNVK
jgi:hypothetical protein